MNALTLFSFGDKSMHLFSKENAGKKVNTRWGVIAFDADGEADHKIPDSDIPYIELLGWHIDTTDQRARALAALETAKTTPQVPAQTTAVSVVIAHPESAGKKAKTRWGVIAFDADGVASATIPEADLPLLGLLGWSYVADKPKKAKDNKTENKPDNKPDNKTDNKNAEEKK